jgi:hypothetical protein
MKVTSAPAFAKAAPKPPPTPPVPITAMRITNLLLSTTSYPQAFCLSCGLRRFKPRILCGFLS